MMQARAPKIKMPFLIHSYTSSFWEIASSLASIPRSPTLDVLFGRKSQRRQNVFTPWSVREGGEKGNDSSRQHMQTWYMLQHIYECSGNETTEGYMCLRYREMESKIRGDHSQERRWYLHDQWSWLSREEWIKRLWIMPQEQKRACIRTQTRERERDRYFGKRIRRARAYAKSQRWESKRKRIDVLASD